MKLTKMDAASARHGARVLETRARDYLERHGEDSGAARSMLTTARRLRDIADEIDAAVDALHDYDHREYRDRVDAYGPGENPYERSKS